MAGFSTVRCEESRQVSEQVRPALGTRVAGGNRRYGKGPLDRKIRIVIRHTEIFGWVVRAVDPITHVGHIGQCLKPMQEPRGYVEVTKIVVVKQECLLPPEGRRVPANIDEHVVHGAVCATDQLRLAASGSSVHSPDHAFPGSRLRVLDKRCGASRRAQIVVEDHGVERPCEQPPVIAEGLRSEDQDVRQRYGFDLHWAMLS